jgi:YaaC-like Protein
LYVSLGHAPKRKLLPIEYKFLINESRDRLFVELMYAKQNETKVDTSKFLKGARATYFRTGYPRDGWVVYRSKTRRHATKANMADCYAKFIAESRQFNIVSLLTRNGYRYYCDLQPGLLHHLSYSLLTMFYVGAAARYRPLEVKAVLSGNLRPLVSELVTLAPKQFLYQLTSLLTEKVCLSVCFLCWPLTNYCVL